VSNASAWRDTTNLTARFAQFCGGLHVFRHCIKFEQSRRSDLDQVRYHVMECTKMPGSRKITRRTAVGGIGIGALGVVAAPSILRPPLPSWWPTYLRPLAAISISATSIAF
jgi:hypothetical protein